MKSPLLLSLYACIAMFANTSRFAAAGPQNCGGILFFPNPSRICAGGNQYSDCNVNALFTTTHCGATGDLPWDQLFAKCISSNSNSNCCLAAKPLGGISLAQYGADIVETPAGPQVRLLFNFVTGSLQSTFVYNVVGWENQRSGEIRGQLVYTCSNGGRSAGSFYLDLPIEVDDDTILDQTMDLTVGQEGEDGVEDWTGTFSVSKQGDVTTSHVISATATTSGAFLLSSSIPFLFDDSTLSPTISVNPTLAPSVAPSDKSRDELPSDPQSEENGSIVFIALGSVSAIGAAAVAIVVVRRRTRRKDVDDYTSSASSSPQNVIGEYPPTALRNSHFSVAADNPLRADTISSKDTFARGAMSSRFMSLFLPTWGDRANLGRSTMKVRNKVTSSKLLGMNENKRVSAFGFKASFQSIPHAKKLKRQRSSTPDVL